MELDNLLSEKYDGVPPELINIHSNIKKQEESFSLEIKALDRYICEKLVFYRDQNRFQEYKNFLKSHLNFLRSSAVSQQCREKSYSYSILRDLNDSMNYFITSHTKFSPRMNEIIDRAKQRLKKLDE